MIEFFIGLLLGLGTYHVAHDISKRNINFRRKRNPKCIVEKYESPSYRYNACVEIKGVVAYTSSNTISNKNIIGFVKKNNGG